MGFHSKTPLTAGFPDFRVTNSPSMRRQVRKAVRDLGDVLYKKPRGCMDCPANLPRRGSPRIFRPSSRHFWCSNSCTKDTFWTCFHGTRHLEPVFLLTLWLTDYIPSIPRTIPTSTWGELLPIGPNWSGSRFLKLVGQWMVLPPFPMVRYWRIPSKANQKKDMAPLKDRPVNQHQSECPRWWFTMIYWFTCTFHPL